MTVKNWWLERRFGCKVCLRKEAKNRPLLQSGVGTSHRWFLLGQCPLSFVAVWPGKEPRTLPAAYRHLWIAQMPRQRKETVVAALLVLAVTWIKTLSFPAMQSQRLFNSQIRLYPPNQHQLVWGAALSWLPTVYRLVKGRASPTWHYSPLEGVISS